MNQNQDGVVLPSPRERAEEARQIAISLRMEHLRISAQFLAALLRRDYDDAIACCATEEELERHDFPVERSTMIANLYANELLRTFGLVHEKSREAPTPQATPG